jgi:hypothetical protein
VKGATIAGFGLGTVWVLNQVSAKRLHAGQLGFEGTNDVVLVMTQRMFDCPTPPRMRRDLQASAHAALG